LAAKEKDVGAWVADFIDPSPDRQDPMGGISKYQHAQGLRAGDTTQFGQVFALCVEAAASGPPTDLRHDFCTKLDAFLTTLSGESLSGRYTDAIYIKVRQARLDGKDWGRAGTATDETTPDGAALAVVLAALYRDPAELVDVAFDLLSTLIGEDFILHNSIVFGLVVQALINGVPVEEFRMYFRKLGQGVLKGKLGSFDNFLTPVWGAAGLSGSPNKVVVEPPKLVSLLFGLDCQLTHVLPAAYFLVHRFPDDFENAVLSAANGGGQNVARAALTGALSGAAVGVGQIPKRFINGLSGGAEFLQQAKKDGPPPRPPVA